VRERSGMKTTIAILLALILLVIGVLAAIGYLVLDWLIPFMKEHLP
jgi:uncharacterized protein YxeA